MPTVLIFYEWEIPDSHRYIFIVKTQSLFVDLNHKLISDKFSGVKTDFRFDKKSEQLALVYMYRNKVDYLVIQYKAYYLKFSGKPYKKP